MRTGQVAGGKQRRCCARGGWGMFASIRPRHRGRDAGECRLRAASLFPHRRLPHPPPNPSSHRQVLALAREGAKYGVLVVTAGAILMVKKVRGASTRVQPMRARAGVHKQTLRPRAHTVASRR
jgi:hypothetical protein